MPKEAKILLFHHDPDMESGLKDIFSPDGHKIIKSVRTFKEAEQVISDPARVDFNLIVVEDKANPYGEDEENRTGNRFVQRVRRVLPNIKIVGLGLFEPVLGDDLDFSPDTQDFAHLSMSISAL